jgi:hypothetical protein
MKRLWFIIVCPLIISSATTIMGCKYDVANPLWEEPPASTTVATITAISPTEASAGVNYITITGTNFGGVVDTTLIHSVLTGEDTTIVYNGVYFNDVSVEILDASPTSVKVRRPNLVSDSCTVKVVPGRALVAARTGPYKIAQVIQTYGSFLENAELSVVAVDNSENLYAVYASSRTIYKVTPTGVKTIVGAASRVPTDARIGPGGKLYLTENNRAIDVVDVDAGTVERWIQLPSGRVVKFGDFDANGYFYTAGTRSQLAVVTPDLSVIQTGLYATDDVQSVRVYNGDVYLAVKAAAGVTPSLAVWKHSLDSVAINGHLGSAQLVLNLDETPFTSRTIKAFTFSSNGVMYIATDSPDPILVFDPTSSQVDYFYKGIVPPYCKHFYWGKGNYLYLISGNASPEQEWNVYRLDLGTTGAPYYGG